MNLKFKESFEKTRIAGSIASAALDEVKKIIRPGITTSEIDDLCYEFINDHKVKYNNKPNTCHKCHYLPEGLCKLYNSNKGFVLDVEKRLITYNKSSVEESLIHQCRNENHEKSCFLKSMTISTILFSSTLYVLFKTIKKIRSDLSTQNN